MLSASLLKSRRKLGKTVYNLRGEGNYHRKMRQETEQRLRLTLMFFPGGIRFVDLVRRSGLSRRSVWRVLYGYGEQPGLVEVGLVGVSKGGYSVLPSSISEFRRHLGRKRLDRRRPASKLPKSSLRKLTGVFLPKTPYYRLLPQTLDPGSRSGGNCRT